MELERLAAGNGAEDGDGCGGRIVTVSLDYTTLLDVT